MASALLASRNEPYFGDSIGGYMRKPPNPKIPNPRIGHGYNQAVSGDSSSLRPKQPLDLGRRSEDGRSVMYDLSNYSKRELRELKRRLVCELEQVRAVSSRIETRQPVKDPNFLNPQARKLTSSMMKRCGQILSKLMKQNGAVWFNAPVDAEALNLFDYHQIIKHPMDLGTARAKVGKRMYTTPAEFAADIRLTFNNALTYNPPEHVVHKFASQLLRMFESAFNPAYDKYEKQLAAIAREDEQRRRAMESWSRPQPVTFSALKQPKPKAKEMNKRAMSNEEKQKLGMGLQELPQEKMSQILQIIQKRNVETVQAGDEVEIDFEVMDNETLWELDRFVTNWKKSSTKVKRHDVPIPAPPVEKKPDPVEEDVDIGDDLPVTNYPSVEIVKDGDSSSSSSGSDSTSGSGSESGSSSGSDSEDGAESHAAGN